MNTFVFQLQASFIYSLDKFYLCRLWMHLDRHKSKNTSIILLIEQNKTKKTLYNKQNYLLSKSIHDSKQSENQNTVTLSFESSNHLFTQVTLGLIELQS